MCVREAFIGCCSRSVLVLTGKESRYSKEAAREGGREQEARTHASSLLMPLVVYVSCFSMMSLKVCLHYRGVSLEKKLMKGCRVFLSVLPFHSFFPASFLLSSYSSHFVVCNKEFLRWVRYCRNYLLGICLVLLITLYCHSRAPSSTLPINPH